MQLQITPRPTKKSLAYKSGRQNGMRIQLLINKTNWTLKRISDCVSVIINSDTINSSGIVNCINNESDTINSSGIVNCIKANIYRRNLTDTLKGKRNTPHYILALEKCWLLPIEKIRELYQLDLIGEPSIKEQLELTDYYNKILSEARKDGRYINPRLSVAILSNEEREISDRNRKISQRSKLERVAILSHEEREIPTGGNAEKVDWEMEFKSQSSHTRKGNSHRKWSAKFDWKSKRASQSSHARNGNSHH